MEVESRRGLVKLKDTLVIVCGAESALHEADLELIDTRQRRYGRLGSETFNFVANVDDVLHVCCSDVILENTLHHLLLFLRHIFRFFILQSFLQIDAQVLLELTHLVAESRVPEVLSGVVRAAEQD